MDVEPHPLERESRRVGRFSACLARLLTIPLAKLVVREQNYCEDRHHNDEFDQRVAVVTAEPAAEFCMTLAICTTSFSSADPGRA
jgi:hypothetical protein